MNIWVWFAFVVGCDHCGSKSWQYLFFYGNNLISLNTGNLDLSGLHIVIELVFVHKINPNDIIG